MTVILISIVVTILVIGAYFLKCRDGYLDYVEEVTDEVNKKSAVPFTKLVVKHHVLTKHCYKKNVLAVDAAKGLIHRYYGGKV